MAKRGRPKKFTLKELEKRIAGYFAHCDEHKEPYCITGLALALDTSRRSLLNWEKDDEFFHAIKRAKDECEFYIEKEALKGKLPPAVAIFCLKNFGWTDKQEHEHTGKDGAPFTFTIQLETNGKGDV